MRCLILLLCLCGCSKSESDSKPAESTPATPATAPADAGIATRSADAAAQAPTVAPTTDADARAVVAAWLDAQNRGDFKAYQALYAAGFRGVQRVGSQTRELDLAAWLKSRKKMFAQKPKVAADGLVIGPLPTGADVAFVQRWQIPGYADHGDKRMTLEYDAARQLRIAREEMLTSKPGWEDPPADQVVDATGLGKQISMWIEVGTPSGSEYCKPATFSLSLESAERGNKNKASREIGAGFLEAPAEGKVGPDDEPEDGWLYSRFGDGCGDAGHGYGIKRHGDTLLLQQRPRNDETDGKTLFVVQLAPGAKIQAYESYEAYFGPEDDEEGWQGD